MSVTPKESKYRQVAHSVLSIIDQSGTKGVNHSNVSRRAKVSRPWLYEYVASTREGLIEFAAQHLSAELARWQLKLTPANLEELEQNLADSTEFLLNFAEKNPIVIKSYFRFRGSSTAIGKVITFHETQWLNSSSATLIRLLNVSAENAGDLSRTILILRMGLLFQIASSPLKAQSIDFARRILNLVQTYGSLMVKGNIYRL